VIFTPLAFLAALFSGNWGILVLGFVADVAINVLMFAMHLLTALFVWMFGGSN